MYFVLIAVKWNTSSKADEPEKNRETLENKRRKSCGPIYINPSSSPGRKYIMQSGIGKVVLRRNSGGKTMGKNEPHNRIYSTSAASPCFFRNCWFRKTGSRLRSAKISNPPPLPWPPPLALVNRNHPTKWNKYIKRVEEGRGGESKIHAHVHVRESFSSLFLGLLIKIKNDLFP